MEIDTHDPPTKRKRPPHTFREAGKNGNILTFTAPLVFKSTVSNRMVPEGLADLSLVG